MEKMRLVILEAKQIKEKLIRCFRIDLSARTFRSVDSESLYNIILAEKQIRIDQKCK